jgi:hypothetical protein
MDEKSNLYIVAIVGVIAVVALVVLATSAEREKVVYSGAVNTATASGDSAGQVTKATESEIMCMSNCLKEGESPGESYCRSRCQINSDVNP